MRNDLAESIVVTLSAKGRDARGAEPREYRLNPGERVESKLRWFFDAPERIVLAVVAGGRAQRWSLGPADYTPMMRTGGSLGRTYQVAIGSGRPVIQDGPGEPEPVYGEIANGLYLALALLGAIVVAVKWRQSRLRPWQV